MPEKHPKRPRDLNQWAKAMVDLATNQPSEEPESEGEPGEPKNPAAVALGRLGGQPNYNLDKRRTGVLMLERQADEFYFDPIEVFFEVPLSPTKEMIEAAYWSAYDEDAEGVWASMLDSWIKGTASGTYFLAVAPYRAPGTPKTDS